MKEQENAVKVVWALAWPAVALNSMQVINTLLDSFFVGNLKESSVTAYGGMTPVLFLMFSLAMTFGTASTALVSRAFGAGNRDEWRAASRQTSALSFLTGCVLGAVCWLLAEPAAQLMLPEKSGEAVTLMAQFFRVYAVGLPAIYLVQALAGSLRGTGDTKSPMVISGITICLHILFNLLLIRETLTIGGVQFKTAGMGLQGAGIALTSSACISGLIYAFWASRTAIGNQNPLLLPKLQWVQRIVKVAVPSAVMNVLRVGSLGAFQFALKYVPDGGHAIAALRPAFAIESIMFMPSFGLSMAAAALVGQSLGMKNAARAERLAWAAAHMGASITLILCIPVAVFAPLISHIQLGDKPEIVHQSVSLLRTLCTTEVFFAYAMVLIGAMQGAGDTRRPLWVTIVNLWMLRVPLAYTLALSTGVLPWLPFGFGMGALGAWTAMAISQATQGAMSMVIFKFGAWKTTQV
ncbi:MAG: MATE family efflux transporter [Fimbriimonadaceae bacterium]